MKMCQELDCSQNLKRCHEWLQVVDEDMNHPGDNLIGPLHGF